MKAGTVLRDSNGVLWIYACREGRRSAYSRAVYHLVVRPGAKPRHLTAAQLACFRVMPEGRIEPGPHFMELFHRTVQADADRAREGQTVADLKLS